MRGRDAAPNGRSCLPGSVTGCLASSLPSFLPAFLPSSSLSAQLLAAALAPPTVRQRPHNHNDHWVQPQFQAAVPQLLFPCPPPLVVAAARKRGSSFPRRPRWEKSQIHCSLTSASNFRRRVGSRAFQRLWSRMVDFATRGVSSSAKRSLGVACKGFSSELRRELLVKRDIS